MLKLSMVIPTYNHLEDFLIPCIKSITKYTNLDDKEVIIVANGCVDGTREYVESLGEPFKLVWFDEPLGYTKATNEGIKASQGEFVMLLNSDTEVLPSEKNYWTNELLKPFEDPKMGITGVLMSDCEFTDKPFLIFCCVIIKRELFDKIGLLDEIFSPGYGEDTDYCLKARAAGYKIIQVPDEKQVPDDLNRVMVGTFPFYHKGEGTFDHEEEYPSVINRNRKILTYRYNTHPLKLNLGCGDLKFDGYVNLDKYSEADFNLDVTKLNMFLDNTVDEIQAIHLFEHFNPYSVHDILIEWYRVMKPGGKLVLELPDILELCISFVTADEGKRYEILNSIYGTTQIEHPHLFGWYDKILINELSQAGFVNAVKLPIKFDQHWGKNFRIECNKPGGPALPDPIPIKKLNLGCGSRPSPGYTNVDLYHTEHADLVCDIRKLPMVADNTIEEIYTSHTLEHIDPTETPAILEEWLRVLQPGGKVIIEVPDIMAICKELQDCTDKQRMYQLLNAIYGTANPECPHRWGWERSILFDHLWAAGFIDMVEIPASEGWVPSIAVEAIKPTIEYRCKGCGNIWK